MANRAERIEQTLSDAMSLMHLQVIDESGNHSVPEGAESHFKVVVVSDKFEGVRPLIKRHRLVTAAITADTGGQLDFHSLSVAAAKTPAEWDGVVAPSPKCAGGDGRGTKR